MTEEIKVTQMTKEQYEEFMNVKIPTMEFTEHNKEREGEKIGGGFFVFRRGKKTNRISVSGRSMPFEHPDFKSASEEVYRLKKENPRERYYVFLAIELAGEDSYSVGYPYTP